VAAAELAAQQQAAALTRAAAAAATSKAAATSAADAMARAPKGEAAGGRFANAFITAAKAAATSREQLSGMADALAEARARKERVAGLSISSTALAKLRAEISETEPKLAPALAAAAAAELQAETAAAALRLLHAAADSTRRLATNARFKSADVAPPQACALSAMHTVREAGAWSQELFASAVADKATVAEKAAAAARRASSTAEAAAKGLGKAGPAGGTVATAQRAAAAAAAAAATAAAELAAAQRAWPDRELAYARAQATPTDAALNAQQASVWRQQAARTLSERTVAAATAVRAPLLQLCTSAAQRDYACSALSPETAAQRQKLKNQLARLQGSARLSADAAAGVNGGFLQRLCEAHETLLRHMSAIELECAAESAAIEVAVAAFAQPLSDVEAAQWAAQCERDVLAALPAAKKAAAAAAGPREALASLQNRLAILQPSMRSERATLKKAAPRMGLAAGSTAEAVAAEVARVGAATAALEKTAALIRSAAATARSAAVALLRDRDSDVLAALGFDGKLEDQEAQANRAHIDKLLTPEDPCPWSVLLDVRHPDGLMQPGYSWVLAAATKLKNELHAKAEKRALKRSEDAARARATAAASAEAFAALGGAAQQAKLEAVLRDARAKRDAHDAVRSALLTAYDATHDSLDLDAPFAIDGKSAARFGAAAGAALSARKHVRDTAMAKSAAAAAAVQAAEQQRNDAHRAFEAALAAPMTEPIARDCARWAGLAPGRGCLLPYRHNAPLERIAAPYDKSPLALLLEDTPPALMPSLHALMRRAESCGAAAAMKRAAHVYAATGNTLLLSSLPAAALVAVDADGATPILVALRSFTESSISPSAKAHDASSGQRPKASSGLEAADWLLSAGKGAGATAVDNRGRGCLHELRHTGARGTALCARLLALRADARAADAAGETPVHAAAAALSAPLLKLLLAAAGTDARLMRDGAGRTPLLCALAAAGKDGTSASPEATDAAVSAVLTLAALAVADAAGVRPIAHAAAAPSLPLAVCAALAAACAAQNDAQLAASCGGCALHAIARVPSSEAGLLIGRLLRCGDGSEARLRAGTSPALALHVAASTEAVEALLAAFPAGLNERDAAGRTPFWHACNADAAACATVLLAAGAAAVGDEAADKDGTRPYDVAGPACRALLKMAQEAHEKARAQTMAKLRKRAGDAGDAPAPAPPSEEEVATWTKRAEEALAVLQAEVDAAVAAGPHEQHEARAQTLQAQAALPVFEPAPHDAALEQLDTRRWQVQLSREAKLSLFALPGALRAAALRMLTALSDGDFGKAIFLKTQLGHVFKADVSRHGGGGLRAVFELTPAYSARARGSEDEDGEYVQVVRVWGIAKHDKVSAVVEEIVSALRCGQAASRAVRLVRCGGGGSEAPQRDDMHPRTYRRLEDAAPRVPGELALKPAADTSIASELLPRVFTVANSDLARAVLSRPDADRADWPLHVDQAEAALINLSFDAPVLLLGRRRVASHTCAHTHARAPRAHTRIPATRTHCVGSGRCALCAFLHPLRSLRSLPVARARRPWRGCECGACSARALHALCSSPRRASCATACVTSSTGRSAARALLSTTTRRRCPPRSPAAPPGPSS
jgi:ankyrin repeat protein